MKTAGCFKRFLRRKGAVFGTDPRMDRLLCDQWDGQVGTLPHYRRCNHLLGVCLDGDVHAACDCGISDLAAGQPVRFLLVRARRNVAQFLEMVRELPLLPSLLRGKPWSDRISTLPGFWRRHLRSPNRLFWIVAEAGRSPHRRQFEFPETKGTQVADGLRSQSEVDALFR